MSGHYDYPMSIPPLDQFDPNYAMYDQQYGGFSRMSGSTTPHDGFAFWYRPDPQDSIYQRDPSLFGQPMPMQATPLTMGDAANQQKHRRTRSGCFTCRSRRVKCDETRPVCDRCRKGNRECEFPQSTSSTKRAKTGNPKSASSETTVDGKLDVIKDESEEEDEDDDEDEEQNAAETSNHQSNRPTVHRLRTRSINRTSTPQSSLQQVSSSSCQSDQPETPSTDCSGLETPLSPVARKTSPDPTQHWRQLKPDLKSEMEFYLMFQRDYMTCYHYMIRVDPEDFVHKELIDLALHFEPLLYAVVAFAAYHHTVRLPDSQANYKSFWKYYCRSIIKLREYLGSNNERGDAVLLTVLQLATFEEYMGDWTNLATHHKAAQGILVSKYTPETIMATGRGRKILDWYVRLDVISSLMAVRDVSLDRSWLTYALEWYDERSKNEDGNDINYKLDFFKKSLEVIGHDTAHTFAKSNALIEQGGFSIESVLDEAKKLTDRLDKLRRDIQELNHSEMTGVDNPITTHCDDDAFDPNVPLFRAGLWPLNIVWLDWYGMLILLKNQTLLAMKKARSIEIFGDTPGDGNGELPAVPPEFTRYSKIQCQIFNAINHSPTAPEGATLICYAALGVSTVFLPRAPPASNNKYTLWARRQLASIERQGYIWPPHFRKEMAQLWQIPEIEDWWLENGEGKPKILKDIRAIVEDRIAAVSESGKDDGRNDLREIKGIFEKMDINQLHRRSSNALDPAYVNSSIGMAHAASLVSTPEEGSSGGSASGFSPRPVSAEVENRRHGPRSRKSSRAGNQEPPLMHSETSSSSRMSGIWEEQK